MMKVFGKGDGCWARGKRDGSLEILLGQNDALARRHSFILRKKEANGLSKFPIFSHVPNQL